MASQPLCQSIQSFDVILDPECFEDVWSSSPTDVAGACVYKPGGQVKGSLRVVVVPCLQPFNFSGIYIDARGEMHLEYTCEETVYANDHKVFMLLPKQQLFGGVAGQLQCLPPGEHQFPFKFDIPTTIPSSYNGRFGTVKYWIDTYMEQSSSGVKVTGRTDIIIHGFYDLTTEPEALIPVEKSEEVLAGCELCPGLVCCRRGSFGYSLTLPKRGYSHGEKIQPNIVLNNRTAWVAEVALRLIQDERYGNSYEKEAWYYTGEVLGEIFLEVGANSSCEWNTELKIKDQLMPSKFTLCPNLKIKYTLQLKYVLSSYCSREMSLDVELFIGHMPENFITLPAHGPQTFVHPEVNLSTPQSSRGEEQPLLPPPYGKGGSPTQPSALPSAPPVIHQPYPLSVYGDNRPAPPSYDETVAVMDMPGPSCTLPDTPDHTVQHEKNEKLS